MYTIITYAGIHLHVCPTTSPIPIDIGVKRAILNMVNSCSFCQIMMKRIIFTIGASLLFLSILRIPLIQISNASLVLFGLLILIAFFDDLQEFDFFGLKGKKVQQQLASLKERVTKTPSAQATNPPDDELSKIKKKKIQLMGVDRGNFLALVFEIERLLRGIAVELHPREMTESSPISQVTEYLAENGYLTATGLDQWKALSEVRNIIVQGRFPIENDSALADWIELAYSLYSEIYDDLVTQPKTVRRKKTSS